MKYFANEVSSLPCVYSNGLSLQFPDASEVILLIPSSQLIQVDALIRSEHPKQLWEKVMTVMDIDSTKILFLFPKQIFENPNTFPLKLEHLDVVNKKEHVNNLSFAEIEEGMLGDSTQQQIYPWSLIDGLNITTPAIPESPLNILELKLPGLGLFLCWLIVQLTFKGQHWESEAHKLEFQRVQQVFQYFIGIDIHRQYKLDKVVVLKNKVLEKFCSNL